MHFVRREIVMSSVDAISPSYLTPETIGDNICAKCTSRGRSICRVFEPAHLARLNATVQRRELEPDEALLSEGGKAKNIYVVTSGCLKLYRATADGGKEIIGFRFPGNALGRVLGTQHYNYIAEAVTESAVCVFGQEQFEQLSRAFPQLEGDLLEEIFDDFASIQDQAQMRQLKSPLERVASFLETMCEQQEVQRGSRTVIDLPMAPTDIADFLELSFESMNAAFSALKHEHAINFVLHDKIVVKDRGKLAEFAGMDHPLPKRKAQRAGTVFPS
jgi:CRP/FNR family transcriptional regulator